MNESLQSPVTRGIGIPCECGPVALLREHVSRVASSPLAVLLAQILLFLPTVTLIAGDSPAENIADRPTETERHWAYEPITDHPLPSIQDRNWPRTGIDHFILAKLEQHGLRPAPRADKRRLVRRASFALIGLPPTPSEADSFVRDESPGGFVHLVERLLQSPRYGERWGRHWLDVARYADSNGMDENLAYTTAWRYRDYVIAAFNEDRPYDEFVRDQIAGDLYGLGTLGAGGMPRLVGTAFLTVGPKMLAEDDPVKMEMDIVDEQLDTTSRAFMGVTVGCARCHDHKFDPVSMKEYYAMAGVFKSTKTMENFNVVARWQELPVGSPEELAELKLHRNRLAKQNERIKKLTADAKRELLDTARRDAGRYLDAVAKSLATDSWSDSTRSDPFDEGVNVGRETFMVEAEAFKRSENLTVYQDGYGEGIGIIAGPGDVTNAANYEIVVSRAGQFRVDLRYAAATPRPVTLWINGRIVKTNAANSVTGSWNPDTQQWKQEGYFKFVAGTNYVRLERYHSIPHIDKLFFAEMTEAEVARFGPVLSPSTSRSGLVPEFVDQWKAYLKKSREMTNSVMSLWHRLDSACVEDADSAWDEVLLAEPRPRSLEQLVNRYAELFTAVEDAWHSIRSSVQDDASAKLSDPVLEKFRQVAHDPKGPFALPQGTTRYYSESARDRLEKAQQKLQGVEKTMPRLPLVMAVKDGEVTDLRVHKRGSHLRQGEVSARGFLKSIGGPAYSELDANVSGRLEFAEWLTHPDHPLTARVMVNRIWHWHFGKGLVRSPDNFGQLGEKPTHPELLDWLAIRFRESGWSIKAMHRLIMNSAVYQQSVRPGKADQASAPLEDVDPENRLWSHFNRRRLEVEAIRDAICYVAGNLDLRRTDSLLGIPNRGYVTSSANNMDMRVFDRPVRAVYLPVVRSALYDLFQAYDFADPSVMNGDRAQTVVAPQALFMMNSKIVANQAMHLAKTLIDDKRVDDGARVDQLYRRAYGRSPTEPERHASLAYVTDYHSRTVEGGKDPKSGRVEAWRSLCRSVMSANEFVYVE